MYFGVCVTTTKEKEAMNWKEIKSIHGQELEEIKRMQEMMQL